MRSRPPVERRLEKRLEKLVANGLAAEPRECSCESSGSIATSAGPTLSAVAPRLVKKVSELLEKAGSLVKVWLIAGAAMPRLVNAGVIWSARAARRSIEGPS